MTKNRSKFRCPHCKTEVLEPSLAKQVFHPCGSFKNRVMKELKRVDDEEPR